MLWYKAWLETRWRFLIGLLLLSLSAAGVVAAYASVVALMPMVPATVEGELGRLIREAADVSRTYRGYIWWQWFRQNLPNLWTLFAAILGTGGLLAQASGGGTLYTLSLPVTRNRLLLIRASTGLIELFALAFIPSLIVALLSPAFGQSYSVTDAVIHSMCLFIAGAVFFGLAFLLSTVFGDVWRPLLIALFVAGALAVLEQLSRDIGRIGLFRVMTAEAYFRDGVLPWPGLLISAALLMVMLYAASRNLARAEF